MKNAVFSNDTSQLITLSPDGGVKKWESATGKLIPDACLDFKLFPHNMLALVLSSDAKLLAISDVYQLIVWDVQSGKQLHGFKLRGYTDCRVVFSGDSMFVAVTNRSFVEIWNLATGKLTRLSRHYIRPVILSPDFKLAAGEIIDGSEIFDVSTGKMICKLEDAGIPILLSNNSSYLVSQNSTLFKVSHVLSGKVIIRLHAETTTFNFSDDTKFLASGDGSGKINVWNIEEKVIVRSFSGHTSSIRSVAFSRDAEFLVSGSGESVKVWVTDFGSINHQPQSDSNEHYHTTGAVALSADGNITATISEQAIRFWNTRKLPQIQATWQSQEFNKRILNTSYSPALTISRDSKLIAIGCYVTFSSEVSHGHGISMWSIDSISRGLTCSLWSIDLYSPTGGRFMNLFDIADIAFLPNSEFLAVAYHTVAEYAIVILRVEPRERVYHQVVPATDPEATRFFVDDEYLYVVTDTECYKLEVSTGISLEPDDIRLIPIDQINIGYSLGTSRHWISWNGMDMIWLPGDLRPMQLNSFSAQAAGIALGTKLKDLVIMKFEEPPPEEADWTPWKSSGFL